MTLLSEAERQFIEAASRLAYSNPFLPERIEAEREALGEAFDEAGANWNIRGQAGIDPSNLTALLDRCRGIADQVCQRLRDDPKGAKPDELSIYEDMVLVLLYHHYRPQLDATVQQLIMRRTSAAHIEYYDDFLRDYERYLAPTRKGTGTPSTPTEPAHIFACLFQIRRAFHHIHMYIAGGSKPTVRLRGAVWQSIFTHDMRRYRRVLYQRMGDITTLITGESGTGKELVARAIGMSRYIPFDPQSRTFTEDFVGSFFPLNLSALSPTLIESELFGHRRGAFTGAVADRKGWLEVCPPLGGVFLDEIGDLDASIQVKLLRVIQTRQFQRIGDTKDRDFLGKIIAATHRDLTAMMHAGEFRTDFYYRLCSDIVRVPSLRDRLLDDRAELHDLLFVLAKRLVGDEAEPLAAEVEAWIDKELADDYAWPGNPLCLGCGGSALMMSLAFVHAPPHWWEDSVGAWATVALFLAATPTLALLLKLRRAFRKRPVALRWTMAGAAWAIVFAIASLIVIFFD